MKSISVLGVIAFAFASFFALNASEQERPKCCGQEIKAASKECGCSYGEPCKCGNACECNLHLLTNAPVKSELVKQPASKPRGRKAPSEAELQRRHGRAFNRHDHRMKHLPTATPTSYNLIDLGKTLPAGDQGQCGDCYLYSAMRVASEAVIFGSAGAMKYDNTFRFSTQWGLDCHRELGGCDGGDEAEVIALVKSGGAPIDAEYGPYRANPSQCKQAKMYPLVKDWGYCTPGQQQGVASVQDIKNAIMQFGTVSTAIVANSSWDGYHGGVLPFDASSPNQVDHAVSIAGWKDDASLRGGGYFIVVNNWGDYWGDGKGCIYVQYGSHQIGTEAFWVTAASLPPPPGPIPPGPGPTPPPLGPVSITLSAAMPAGTYQVVPTGTKIMTPEQVQRLKSLLEEVQK